MFLQIDSSTCMNLKVDCSKNAYYTEIPPKEKDKDKLDNLYMQ